MSYTVEMFFRDGSNTFDTDHEDASAEDRIEELLSSLKDIRECYGELPERAFVTDSDTGETVCMVAICCTDFGTASIGQ